MAVVQMFIEKFRGVVTINDDHPLAVAQRAKDSAREAASATDTPSAPAPTVSMAPASTPPKPKRGRRAAVREEDGPAVSTSPTD